MSDFNILQPGPWFGPKLDLPNTSSGLSCGTMEEEFLQICSRLKSGDFSARTSLGKFIVSCTDSAIKRQSIRLLCYVVRNRDISLLGDLLTHFDHDEVLSVVIYAPHTLSPQIVPYLFALLEEYEGTSIEEDILSSINKVVPFHYQGGHVDIDELSQRFSAYVKGISLEKYYYEGSEAFAGSLTRSLIEAAATARQQKTPFPLVDVPTLLSIWSGEKCPVFYGELIGDSEFENVINFSRGIANMKWVRGVKYFYGYQVD